MCWNGGKPELRYRQKNEMKKQIKQNSICSHHSTAYPAPIPLSLFVTSIEKTDRVVFDLVNIPVLNFANLN